MIEILRQLSLLIAALSALLGSQFAIPEKQPVFGAIVHQSIQPLLEGKDTKQKSIIKSDEIVKYNFIGTYEDKTYGQTIEIKSVAKIENGGLEVVARAWKGTHQLGFGKDGSVEWERFWIYNPPVLVYDPAGTTVREWIDSTTKELKQKRKFEIDA